jgi:hypothetical protein
MSIRGFFIVLMVVGISGLGLNAQVLKGINDAVNTATEPAKDATKVIKGVAEPAKEINKTTKTVVEAPKKVIKEYDKVDNEIDRTKKEYEKTGDQVQKVTGTGGGGNDKKGGDSTATKTDADAKAVDDPTHKSAVPADYKPEEKPVPAPVVLKKAVDPMDVPRPVPPGSRDNKTASGPLPAQADVPDAKTDADAATSDAKTDVEVSKLNNPDPEVSTSAAADGKPDGGVPEATNSDATTSDATDATNSDAKIAIDPANSNAPEVETDSPERYVEVRQTPRSGEKRPKPDYSHSPARIALEKADFDIETLEDLFRYSNWEGPEREHTVRSVAHALDELQQSISEIKKLDPGQSTWRFEEAYKDMKAAYLVEMKRQK